MKPFLAVLFLFVSLVLAIGQESSPKPFAEMSEEEAFAQLLKYAGIPEAERSPLDGSLEKRGWELINSLAEEGPSKEGANRLGRMITIVGLHPSSTRYSVDQARLLLLEVTPRVQEILDDERRSDYAEFRAGDPFGGTGSKDSPEGYDEFLLSLRYFYDLAEGAMNIIAVKGDSTDIAVFETLAAADSEPFPVSFASMAIAAEDMFKRRLDERSASPFKRNANAQFGGEAGIEYPENEVNASVTSESEALEPSRDAGAESESAKPPNLPAWALAVIAVAVLGILLLLIRGFLRGRVS